MKRFADPLSGLIFLAILVLNGSQSPGSQNPASSDEAVDEARERKVMERFLAVLEKTPRRGTALDRVYGYHVERGSLDAFLKGYRDKVAADPKDGASWLILGLVEAQRGKDSLAVEAFRKAETTRSDDALPAFYLGQALVLVGQPDSASEAFERALARKPLRTDLLDIYQALGRVHQRAHRNDKALAVWDRLEKAFPDDPRVQEQIAHALADESQDAAALIRFESLAKATKDRFRQVQFALEAAELKVRLGKSSEALADFESLLGKLDPESWLYREVRRKVEDVFLRTDDLAGLANYYERWIKKVPDDVEGMARLGRTLANQGRSADARKWFDQAVKLAPSRRELRLALIEQLVQERQYADAASQYEALAKLEPNNPDVIRDWGRMLLRDANRPEIDRKKAAATVWRRLVPDDARDAVMIAQAADLFRQAGLTDDALALYDRAIRLAPDSSQYREYLGEYYHALKRPSDALATWRSTVAGPNRNAKTLGRLGEVLAGFGYRQEALEPLTEACRLEPDDFDLRLRLADLRLALEQPLEAIVELEKAQKSAAADEQLEAVLDRQIRAYQASNTLGGRIDGLRHELEKTPDATGWTRLARLLEADQKPPEAVQAIEQATKIDPRSVPAWVATARLREAAGDLLGSANALRTLTKLDRRSRTDYLTGIAKLESRLGRRGPALEAGRELLAAAPGNPENHQFFAELCFSLGEPDEGLDALRRAARANPSDPKAMLTLAENLARQFRTEEAIELFWRAFAKTLEIEGKLAIVARLADQYLQRNQLDRLIARLERELREPNQQRELSLCLAQAHAASGDYATARLELERLLATNPRDTQLLNQLSTLSEQEGDVTSSAKYLKQALEIAPSAEGTGKLAQLYIRSGDYLEAEALWTRSTEASQDPGRVLSAIDSLLNNGKRDAVLQITARLLRDRPNDWEILYREAIALIGLNRTAEAHQRFQAILDLKGNDDDKSLLTRSKGGGPNASNRPAGTSTSTSVSVSANASRIPTLPIQDRVNSVSRASSSGANGMNMNGGQTGVFIPLDFGQARVAALDWRFNLAQRDSSEEALLKERRAIRDKNPDDPRSLWDWYYLQIIRRDFVESAESAKALARRLSSDLSSQWVFLNSLRNRGVVLRGNPQAGSPTADSSQALPAEELERMLACYRGIQGRRPDIAPAFVVPVLAELQLGNRSKDADAIYRDAMTNLAPGSYYATTLINVAAERGDVDGILAYLTKADQAGVAWSAPSSGVNPSTQPYYARAIALRGEAKAYPGVQNLFDLYLASNLRARSRPRSASGSGFSTSTRNAAVRQSLALTYWMTGQRAQNIGVDYPSAGDHFDQAGLGVLRTLFEVYRRDDAVGDLFNEWQAKADAAQGLEKVDRLLAMGILRWWNDEKDDAAQLIAEAASQPGADASIRMMLAELYERRNEMAEALATVDAIDAIDTATVQKREVLALRLAAATGNIERARVAAERLFGLKLDAEGQVNLAALMHQLSMHELAEAVLARARKSAGNKPPSLLVLMMQYQRQDKPDLALQIALQILRLRPSSSANVLPNPINSYVNPNRTITYQNQGNAATDDDYARQQAIQVLSRSGKLKDLISRAEAQLERSPNSMQVLQTLTEYARVANDKEKTRSLLDRMAKTRPEDAKLRLQVATQLVQLGECAASLDHYKAAVKADPSTLANQFFAVLNAFRQAGKSDDFASMVEGVDLRAVGNSMAIVNIAQNLMNDPGTKVKGLALFRRAWATFPNDRATYVNILNASEDWLLMPELVTYVKDSVIPLNTSGQVAPWFGVDRVQYYANDGRVVALVNRLLDLVASQNKLDELANQVREASVKHPEWLGGRALLAMILLRGEKFDEARLAVTALVGNAKEPASMLARCLVAQELEDHSPIQDLAGELYEAATREYFSRSTMADLYNANGNFSPPVRLQAWYRSSGRMADCRDLILKMAHTKFESKDYDQAYSESQRIGMMGGYAQQLFGMGYPGEAVRLYREQLAAADVMEHNPLASQYFSRPQIAQFAENGIRQALQAAKPEVMASVIAELFRPVEGDAKASAAINLFVSIPSNDFEKASVVSGLVDAMSKVAAGPSSGDAAANLAKLLEQNPRDLEVNIASTLFAFAGGKPEPIDRAVARLAEVVEQTPLEELRASKATRGRIPRPNTRQRDEAAKQLGLWLVARESWTRDSTRKLGDLFATRALEAARRQSDTRWPATILREWGQLALDRGDRETAEKRWEELLELVLPKPETSKPGPKVTRVGQPQAQPPVRAVVIPATPKEDFDKALTLARMAADQKMLALSFKSVREAFRGGSPVGVSLGIDASVANIAGGNSANMNMNLTRNRRVVVDEPNGNTLTGQIQARLVELELLWSRDGASNRQVFEILRDIVLPPSRPMDVELYLSGLNLTTARAPRSTGARLADWAVRAGAVGEVRQVLQARRGNAVSELAGLVLQVQLALKANEPEAATEALNQVEARLRKDSLRVSSELAAHASFPTLSLGLEKPVKAAEAVLDRALANLAPQPGLEPFGTMTLVLAGHEVEGGRLVDARKRYRSYLESQDKAVAQGDPAFVAFRKRLALNKVAAEFAKRGQLGDALEALGQASDIASTRYNETPPQASVASVARQLAKLPPDESYRVLKAWTWPTPERKSVRILALTFPDSDPPPPFDRGGSKTGGVVSNWAMLIDSATRAGQLDALSNDVRSLDEQKVEGARLLLALVAIARGKGVEIMPSVEALATDLARPAAVTPTNFVTYPLGEFLVARACLADPALRSIGERLAQLVSQRLVNQNNTAGLVAILKQDQLAGPIGWNGGPRPILGRDPGLSSWVPAGFNRATPFSEPVTPIWAEQERRIVLASPAGTDGLAFKYPLGGCFEFLAELSATQPAYQVGLNDGDGSIGFGGQVFGSRMNQNQNQNQFGQNVLTPNAFRAYKLEGSNRLVLKFEDGVIRCLVNNIVVAEDRDPSPTSPWLTLVGSGRVSWRGMELQGTPEIPREVKLSHSDRLEGWSASAYVETMAPRAPAPANGPDQTYVEAFDWASREGVIQGRRIDETAMAEDFQSRLAYNRPLLDGESITYEFLHEPGRLEVHPSIGRLAFLLDPGRGVRVHWMTELAYFDPSGLSPGNVADEPENRRGPTPFPIKRDAWNSVKVSLLANVVAIELNGEKVYERSLRPGDDRTFGLFHYKDRTGVRVRNVVLRGDWPSKLEVSPSTGLTAHNPSVADPAERLARHALVGEAELSQDAGMTLKRSKGLPLDARFEALAAWVLPSDDHRTFRLQGDFQPLDPAPSAIVEGTPALNIGHSRVHVGGVADSPSSELVEVARSLGRLDDLARRVEGSKAERPADERGKLGLLAMVKLAQGKDDEAIADLNRLKDLGKTVRAIDPDWVRWPELNASLAAIRTPRARPLALAVLPVPVAEPNGILNASDLWVRQVRQVRAMAEALDRGLGFGEDPGIPGWSPKTNGRAVTRATGYPRSAWVVRDGEWTHDSGAKGASLMLKTPIRGNFEVTADLTTSTGREALLSYAGIQVLPRNDGKTLSIQVDDVSQRDGMLEPPLDLKSGWASWRLTVLDGRATIRINDRVVYERAVPVECDPWLAIYASWPMGGAARNVKITGNPTIPDCLRLSGPPELNGWSAAEYDETMGFNGNAQAWRRRGDEIVGQGPTAVAAIVNEADELVLLSRTISTSRRVTALTPTMLTPQPASAPRPIVTTTTATNRPDSPSTGGRQESVLRYRRPFFEDGVIEYAFFYQPGKVMVHPSLDRLAFLIQPDGVVLHRTTDAAHDRAGLDPTNVAIEPACRRGPSSPPLRPKAWNTLKFAVEGDLVKLTLNDVLIYERPIETNNQRIFGLFHYADETESRVRQMTYRGDWPRALPKP